MVAAYLGYLSYDFVVQFKLFLIDKKKHWDGILHHVVAAFGYVCGSIAGFGSPSMGLVLTAVDFSSIFLCAREIIPKEYETLASINNLIFFVLFTILRIICSPILQYWCGYDLLAAWHIRSGL